MFPYPFPQIDFAQTNQLEILIFLVCFALVLPAYLFFIKEIFFDTSKEKKHPR